MKSPRACLRNWLSSAHPDWLRIARLLRYEIGSMAAHAVGSISPRQRALLARLKTSTHLHLHLAAGRNRVPGWIHVDNGPEADLRFDLRRKWPIATGSASLIFCEHFVDHLNYPEPAGHFFRECARVLAPGGRVRIVVHDAWLLCRAFVDRDASFWAQAAGAQAPYAAALNHLFRFDGFHQFLYDFETLEAIMLRSGFSRVVRSACMESSIAPLRIDIDEPHREVQSIYAEGLK